MTTKPQIRVLVVPVTGAVEARLIDDDVKAFQAVVGGYIEQVTLAHKARRTTLLYVNEEGIINGMPVNTRLTEAFGLPLIEQPVHGPGFISAVEGNSQESVSLTDDEVAAWSRLLALLGAGQLTLIPGGLS